MAISCCRFLCSLHLFSNAEEGLKNGTKCGDKSVYPFLDLLARSHIIKTREGDDGCAFHHD